MRPDKYGGSLRQGIALRVVLAAFVPLFAASGQEPGRGPGVGWRLVGPDVRTTWNSDIPYSLNDGPLWAGRGLSASVTTGAGVWYQWRRVGLEIVVAPTFGYSENRSFDVRLGTEPGRSAYSSPWHVGGASADLPLRFGNRPLRLVDPGQSSITLTLPSVVLGATSAPQWWGPGTRNALVVSNNAAGIPRAFIRNARPIPTRIGTFSAELQLGTLTKSLYFDTLSASNYRSFSGFMLSYHPRADTNVTLGVARAVYAHSNSARPPVRAVFNALRWTPSAGDGDKRPADQIASLFARWAFPASGFEVHGEFARMELPRSLADLLEAPYHSAGYTLGFQWMVPRPRAGHSLRLQSEITALDQDIVFADRVPLDFYTGRAAAQGYTQRGQPIGAAIGPGASSQWIAVDYLAPWWQCGLFVGRTRWEENAMYREGQFATNFMHDVSVLGGARGGVRLLGVDASAELTFAKRFNYLFQNGFANPGGHGTVNIHNITLTTRLTPVARP